MLHRKGIAHNASVCHRGRWIVALAPWAQAQGCVAAIAPVDPLSLQTRFNLSISLLVCTTIVTTFVSFLCNFYFPPSLSLFFPGDASRLCQGQTYGTACHPSTARQFACPSQQYQSSVCSTFPPCRKSAWHPCCLRPC